MMAPAWSVPVPQPVDVAALCTAPSAAPRLTSACASACAAADDRLLAILDSRPSASVWSCSARAARGATLAAGVTPPAATLMKKVIATAPAPGAVMTLAVVDCENFEAPVLHEKVDGAAPELPVAPADKL